MESYREVVQNGTLLTTSHDGYLAKFGAIHRRVLMIAKQVRQPADGPCPLICHRDMMQ